jgi:PAS domain S-box-containing protein
MQPFKSPSIQRKLAIVVLCTSLLGLGIACAAFELYERTSFRRALTDELTALADTVGANSAASLAFDDRKSARDVLAGLSAEHHIVAACLYDSHGTIFAEYRRPGSGPAFQMPPWREDGATFSPEALTLNRTVSMGGEKIGGIAIVSDLTALRAKMREYTEISALVLLLSVLVTLLVSSRLLRLITEPILALSEVAGRISAQEDYSLRAIPQSDDEIGKLIDSFNQMLGRIQERDTALQEAKDDLELRVEARTRELQLEVNERKQAEVKLQSSLRELEDLKFALDQHCNVSRTDEEGIITFVNERFCSISKFSHDELMGKNHRVVNSGHHPKEFFGELWRTIKSGQSWKGEVKNRAKDGNLFWSDTTIVPFCDTQGKPFQYIGIRTDITSLKRIEEELRRAKDIAEQASRAKSEFLANMSHEIRTPLNGIMGMTDLALETELSREQREYLETVKSSSGTLLTVINDILDFSKIDAGKIDLEVDDFDLRDSLETTLKTLAVRADEKGLELLCEVAPEVPEVVRGDVTRLKQVVMNLVGNAIKFTNQGEVAVKVQVEAEDGRDLVLQFTVSDTGIGIAEDKQGKIFDPFAQADTSTTRKYGGTGLGLTISVRLVRMMGGKIWVESEEGRGSHFHFTVRVGAADHKEIKVGSAAPPEILRGVRVLVVDDNDTNRRILEGVLKRWEMRPVSAKGGEEALAQLVSARKARDAFGLIVTDMHMPKMDGFELVERIRRRPELSTATIMMLTSSGHRGDAERCQKLGVSAYLLKPIRQSELREAIARVLGAREQEGKIPLITRFSLGDARDGSGFLRVLVAEDNPVNQRLIVRLLEKRGHRVVLADNGRQALAALEKESFDLVLMDVQMPEMDGFEATSAIRTREKSIGSHQTIIALTAHAMKGDREECLARGMDGYLTKPIRPQDLDEVLARCGARPHVVA